MMRQQLTPNDAPRVTTHTPSIPAALRNFDQMPDSAYVRLPVVCGLFGCSPATVWRRVKAGTIPKPKKFGDKHTAWPVGSLREVLTTTAASPLQRRDDA